MERRIPLEGCFNFRDLGGYPGEGGRQVRWRQVFRSDALHHLTARDVARLQDEIGIGHIVDLRSTAELEAEGRGLLENSPARFHHLPLYDGSASEGRERAASLSLADRYVLMADFARKPIARVLETLAASDAPAVYHCAAGKDRTGMISAILLGVLGVPDEIIVADYAASREQLDAIVDRLMAAEGYQAMLEALPPDTLHAVPETMVSLLRQLRDRYGSIEGYVREAGAAPETGRRLRARFLA
jgi:protein-tyrosine phosphatase